MKTDAQISEYLRARPGITPQVAYRNLRRHGIPYAKLKGMMGGAPKAGPFTPDPNRSVAHLKAQFDDVAKVQKTMRALPKGQFMEDDEMRRDNKIAIGRWREVRQHPSVAQFLYKLPNGKFVWMHQSAQEELTAAINLSQS